MTQLDYSLYMNTAFIGLISDLQAHRIVSAAAEGVVPFGIAVVPGTDAEKQIIVPTQTGEVFRGVSVATQAVEQNALGDAEYADTSVVSIMKQGTIWVRVNSNVLVDAAAFFVYTGAEVGQFRNDGTSADAVPTGVFRSTANSGDLALLEINLP